MAHSSVQTLFQTAKECHGLLDGVGVPHVVIGGLAIFLHGFKRQTRDVDFLVRREDWDRIRKRLTANGYKKKNRTELLSPNGVKVSFCFGGHEPKESEARLPDPANDEFHTMFDDLPGMPVFGDLFELIKHKLECAIIGQSLEGRRARRSRKHFKDVVGLIVSNDLFP